MLPPGVCGESGHWLSPCSAGLSSRKAAVTRAAASGRSCGASRDPDLAEGSPMESGKWSPGSLPTLTDLTAGLAALPSCTGLATWQLSRARALWNMRPGQAAARGGKEGSELRHCSGCTLRARVQGSGHSQVKATPKSLPTTAQQQPWPASAVPKYFTATLPTQRKDRTHFL